MCEIQSVARYKVRIARYILSILRKKSLASLYLCEQFSQNSDFITHNYEFISCNSENLELQNVNSQFREKEPELWDRKYTITFFYFYSVVEMSFRRYLLHFQCNCNWHKNGGDASLSGELLSWVWRKSCKLVQICMFIASYNGRRSSCVCTCAWP